MYGKGKDQRKFLEGWVSTTVLVWSCFLFPSLVGVPAERLAVKAALDELPDEEADLVPGARRHTHALQRLLVSVLHGLQHFAQVHQFLLVQSYLPPEVIDRFTHCKKIYLFLNCAHKPFIFCPLPWRRQI